MKNGYEWFSLLKRIAAAVIVDLQCKVACDRQNLFEMQNQ